MIKNTHLHKTSRIIVSTLSLGITLLGAGCGKSIPSSEQLSPITPSAPDSNAGSWKMIVLSGPTQVPVAAPVAVTDAGYLSELAAIKTGQASLTDAQKTSITYWSAGGVLRWNEYLRELVARADLPPAPTDGGTYPSPSPTNPFAYPTYPFSNPPYAARAYSYVSVAQFEALKAAWYYKYLYNRPSPSKVDSSIQSLLPATGIPSYPSEDAVEAGVNLALLKLLFPTNVDEITAKAADQQQAAMLAGRASSSDIAAGVALGQAVAAIFTTRAGSDGMKAAAGNAAEWQGLIDSTTARGEIPWLSQETPARPPMLPLFGQVKGWMMSPSDFVTARPGPPPSTSSSQMGTETTEVRNTVNNLTRDQLATVYKWADGVSTVTPPGHWNAIAFPYIEKAQMSEVRTARTFALLNMALHDAAVGCWEAKYHYFNPRPSQLSPDIKVQTGLPNFPSYVSGHSDFSAAAADVLEYLFPDGASYFDSQQQEAAMSRLYAGIHYRSDIEVGMQHGKKIGDFTVNFAKTDGAQ
ncbi:membrane-associated phospholipid phosphatase [Granulicella aggregans]|uniref:Membrane-associated phospholipid phosphatase n=1 Tax=Granulicella aggregans TaxID=474949 RepID=A0A7W8E3M3_9BACT|nr:phosphatase PAP2 family protein [Granulicella aggregans]MBB5058143.1 membrane-associated phospholipid phosphatase [Granulicella aggregans]